MGAGVILTVTSRIKGHSSTGLAKITPAGFGGIAECLDSSAALGLLSVSSANCFTESNYCSCSQESCSQRRSSPISLLCVGETVENNVA